jgi:hypothetical protein
MVSDGKRTSIGESPQEGKTTPSKNSPREPDIMEAFKMVVESGQKTLKMIIDSQNSKGTSEEEKLDQEDQRMKIVDLEPLEEPTEESAAIICGDWMHRIRPVIKNLSRRSSKYWQRLEEVVEERYKKFLGSKPVEKLTIEFDKDEELDKDGYSKVRATIQEMIMKALPKGLKTDAIQKRCGTPEAVMLMIMIKYQPGTRKEKEALLDKIQNPESCYNQEKALSNLKLWKRRIERA